MGRGENNLIIINAMVSDDSTSSICFMLIYFGPFIPPKNLTVGPIMVCSLQM